MMTLDQLRNALKEKDRHLIEVIKNDDDLLCNSELWDKLIAEDEYGIWLAGFLTEYADRKLVIAEKITDQATDSLRESLEMLEAITADLPETSYTVTDHAFLWLYVRSITEELRAREKAERDPVYRVKLEAEKEAQARARESYRVKLEAEKEAKARAEKEEKEALARGWKAEELAREYLERTKPRAS